MQNAANFTLNFKTVKTKLKGILSSLLPAVYYFTCSTVELIKF